MALAEISVSYGVKPTPEQFEQLNSAVVIGDPFKLNEEGEFDSYWTNRIVSLDMMPADLAFDVKRMLTHPALTELEHHRNPAFNQKVKVVVPDNGLLKINRVEVRKDMCTVELQGELDDGWCILAVCPQPDQRRPDYVLGKREL